ncbi:MAG: metalloregulator ArsR/SmtB family transcription factor [Tissierellia bacterium]|nr:metalloregulator ArsR/SmtB family transcription factor [Tissierellia bacterium]
MTYTNELSKASEEDIVRKLPSEDTMLRLADFFSVFGDSTRMRIISLLRHRQMNVSQIAEALDVSISAISHQLKTLKSHDLVRLKKDGKYSIYYLSDEHVTRIFDLGLLHLEEKYD